MQPLWRRWLEPREAVDDGRWVVLDVEASGLDAAHDRLLAVAALGVHIRAGRACITLADSFEVVLRQPDDTGTEPDKANIMVHGIGVGAQRAGVEPAFALQTFTCFVARSPLTAFHATFDRTLIERGLGSLRLPCPAGPWLAHRDGGARGVQQGVRSQSARSKNSASASASACGWSKWSM